MWKCNTCDAEIRDMFEACFKCGAKRETGTALPAKGEAKSTVPTFALRASSVGTSLASSVEFDTAVKQGRNRVMERVVANDIRQQEWQCTLCGAKMIGTPVTLQNKGRWDDTIYYKLGYGCASCQLVSCNKCDGFGIRAKKNKCARCKTPLKRPMLALLGRAFSCLIPDKPLTRYEQLVVGIGTGGAFRGNFRIAAVDFVDDQLAVKAATDKVAGGVTVTVATTATRDITEIRATPIPFGFQMEAVLTRSLVVGGGFALTLLIFAIKGGGGGNSGVAVLVSILFVFAMGFLFSFLPGYFLAKKDLSEVQFICKDGHALSVALSPLQMEFAKAILEAQGLHIIESNEAIVMAIT